MNIKSCTWTLTRVSRLQSQTGTVTSRWRQLHRFARLWLVRRQHTHVVISAADQCCNSMPCDLSEGHLVRASVSQSAFTSWPLLQQLLPPPFFSNSDTGWLVCHWALSFIWLSIKAESWRVPVFLVKPSPRGPQAQGYQAGGVPATLVGWGIIWIQSCWVGK